MKSVDNKLDFTGDIIVGLNPIVVLANTTAVNGALYNASATATFTDPTGVEGLGYEVKVLAGSATIGGVAYAIAGSVINRVFQGGVWNSYLIGAGTGGVASFNTRVGPVTFVASDIPATTVTPGAYTNANVTIGSDGRVTAAANGTAGSAGLTSFNGRTAAAAVPTAGDYNAFYGSQVTNTPTIALLENDSNWTTNHYTGTAITNPQNPGDWYVNENYDYKFRTPSAVRRILYSATAPVASGFAYNLPLTF